MCGGRGSKMQENLVLPYRISMFSNLVDAKSKLVDATSNLVDANSKPLKNPVCFWCGPGVLFRCALVDAKSNLVAGKSN